MRVTRSCYYAYLKRKVEQEKAGESIQARRVKECFYLNRRRYGSRRIAKELKMGRFLVRRWMREQQLQAIQPKSFVPRTTDSRHGGRISPNLLKEIGEIAQSGQVIVGDITYLPLANGKFCYLATFQDKYTRRIIGARDHGRNDGRIGRQSVIDGAQTRIDRQKCHYSHRPGKSICLESVSGVIATRTAYGNQ